MEGKLIYLQSYTLFKCKHQCGTKSFSSFLFECLKIIPLHCAACVNIVFALIISNLIGIITKMFYNPYIWINVFFSYVFNTL